MSFKVEPPAETEAPEASSDLEQRTRVLLESELRQRQTALCDQTADVGAAAVIVVALSAFGDDRSAFADVTIDDRLTNKRVQRRVDLRRLPVNGRALSIAIGVDELVGASWAELPAIATTKAPPPIGRPPAPALRQKTRAAEPRRNVDLAAFIALASDRAGGPRLGADAALRWWFLSRLNVGIRVGHRLEQIVQSTDGRIAFDSSLAALDLAWAPTAPVSVAGVEVGPSIEVVRATVQGRPSAGAVGHQSAYWLWVPSLRVSGWVAVSYHLRVTSVMAAGFPTAEVSARDGVAAVPLSSVPLATASLGLTWDLR